jgi:hypothetical protein
LRRAFSVCDGDDDDGGGVDDKDKRLTVGACLFSLLFHTYHRANAAKVSHCSSLEMIKHCAVVFIICSLVVVSHIKQWLNQHYLRTGNIYLWLDDYPLPLPRKKTHLVFLIPRITKGK